MLVRMTHRGACGCDKDSGDGAGILVVIPHEFFAQTIADEKLGWELPNAGEYSIGSFFMPTDSKLCESTMKTIEATADSLGNSVVGWRRVP
eukprot:4224811-Pyramimonas_sp.AAC.1